MPMTKTAFFDLDYTLLSSSSSVIYVKESVKQGFLPLWVVGLVALKYKLRGLDFGQGHAQLITYVGRRGRVATAPFFERLAAEKVLPRLTPAGRAKIEWHQQQGHGVMLVSASIEELVRPVALHLDLGQNYLCTHLVVKADRYTGQLDGPVCHGSGKVHWVKQWAVQNGLDFPQAVGYFYSDSASDLPLLELAAQPVAVNPSRRLAKIAQARGWPIERFY